MFAHRGEGYVAMYGPRVWLLPHTIVFDRVKIRSFVEMIVEMVFGCLYIFSR